MNAQEALEIIKNELPFTSGVIEEALDLVENCVSKQIPKKPNYKYEQTGNEISSIIRFPVCPSCDSISNGEQYAAGFNEKYCLNCGQALDWSDTE